MEELKERTIKKEFVPYDLALELKEFGFDEEVVSMFYNGDNITYLNIPNKVNNEIISINKQKLNCLSRPTFSQAFRFFREKYNLHYIVYKNINIDGYDFCEITIDGIINKNTFKTYEEAELECLVKLIDIVKRQNVK